MEKTIKKTISILIIFAFMFNVVLPIREANAMTAPWWSSSQAHASSGVATGPSSESSLADNTDQNQTDAEPVFIHNGDFIYQYKDLSIPSRGVNSEITRTYKSQSRYNNRFGFGWDIFYNKKIIPLCNGDLFYLNGELNRYRFIYIDGTDYVSPAGIYEKIVQNIDGTYTLTESHGTVYEFDQNGVLTEIRYRNNNSIFFTYDEYGKLPIIGKSIYSNDPSPKIIAYDYKLTQITDSVARSITLNYDSSGHLSEIVDFAGRTHSYNYDPSGNGDLTSYTTPVSDQYPLGNTTIYGYDSEHNLETITDAKSQTYITNRYDAEDRVYEQDYGAGTFHFSYDTTNHKTTVTDPKGFVTEWTYNTDGQATSKKEFTAGLRPTDPSYFTTTYAYNSNLEQTSITYPKGNGIKYTFDEGNLNPQAKGNLLEIRRKADMAAADNDTNDILTSFTYEPNFNFVKTITDPKGNITTYAYDYELDPGDPNYGVAGNLTAIVYPELGGQIPQTSFTYNIYGQLQTVTDPNLNTTEYQYYAATGYLSRIIQDPGGINAVTQFTYDSVGNLASVVDPAGSGTAFTYNQENRLIEQTNSLGYKTRYSYDPNGNLTEAKRQANSTGSQWQTTSYTYTILDQLETIKQYLNPTYYLLTTFSYDLNGNRSSITDANNKVTTYDYDERDLIWKTVDANTPSGITEYSYDYNGNLSQIKDANSNATDYAYDGFDRLYTTTYADSSYSQYTYDKNSNLSELLTPNSELITYAYDALNRLDLKTYPDASTVDYVYDLGSRLTSIENPASSISYVYDALNRISSNTQTINSAAYTLTYSYDKAGKRQRLVYPSGADIRYYYDINNRLVRINDYSQPLVTYKYDTLDRRIEKNLLNSKTKRTTYTYDLANRLLKLKNYIPTPSGGGRGGKIKFEQSLLDNNYFNNQPHRFDIRDYLCAISDHLRSKIFDIGVAEANPGVINSQFTYTYDNVGNRISELRTQNSQLNTYNYAYDDIYQLTGVTGSQVHDYIYDSAGNRLDVDGASYVPNNLNQYDQVGADIFTYDGNGNLTNDGTNVYDYDYENRLITAIGGQNSNYTYDGFGRRISKTVGGLTTYFIYDNDQVIEERDASGLLVASYVYGTGIDEVLTMARGAQTYYYFYDGLGSVTDLTDATGEVIETYSYDVYGEPSTISSVGNPYYFTGRRLDDETGLYYYRARMYSPAIGRFMQRDPIGYYDSMNLYTYVNNNPVNWIDPIGWEKQKSWWEQGWGWYKEQLKNPSARASSYQDPADIWFTQGVPGWQRAYGSRDIDWRGAGKEVGGMASSGYGFYRGVRDSTPPGVSWTGNPYFDVIINTGNLATSTIEKLIEEIKNIR